MACEGGCIGGAGQPKCNLEKKFDVLTKRAQALYESEIKKPVRVSIENPGLLKVYSSYLGEIGEAKAKQLLHRSYEK